MSEANLEELAGFLARAIVTHPDAVEVEEEDDDGRITVKVTVASKDVGRLIGRKGRTIDALRTLVGATGAASNRDATVEVVEPE
jgi:hypothetical protein